MSRTSLTYFLTLLLLTSLITPGVRAHEDIVLSADTLHIALQPGSVENLTLVIENEGDSIVSYDIEAETNSMYWDAIPTESTVEDVYPQLGERNTTIVISLSIEAQPSDSTILNITVTEPGEGISSYLLVVLTVLPMYLPSIDASALGEDGLVTLDPGQSVDLSVQISNHGNVQDTFLLSVDSEPDLAEFWANWTAENSNNSQDNSTGNNSNGKLGNGFSSGTYSTPNAVSGLGAVKTVSAGRTHTCAVLDNGSARCWGYNSNWQLGDGTTTQSTSPVAVSGLGSVYSISAGYNHTCALLDNGRAKCWGSNSNGQLGNGSSGTDNATPGTVINLTNIRLPQ